MKGNQTPHISTAELVGQIIKAMPDSEEKFQTLRNPSAFDAWKNMTAGLAMQLRKRAIAQGDVVLLQSFHTILAEMGSVEDTVNKLGHTLHLA